MHIDKDAQPEFEDAEKIGNAKVTVTLPNYKKVCNKGYLKKRPWKINFVRTVMDDYFSLDISAKCLNYFTGPCEMISQGSFSKNDY
jgi:hypothetical protein